jgi:drug/metabolite transporter (DMT)-like permease
MQTCQTPEQEAMVVGNCIIKKQCQTHNMPEKSNHTVSRPIDLRDSIFTYIKRHKIALAYLALGLGVTSMGFSGIFVSWANAPGPVTGLYRLLFALLLYSGPFAWRVQRKEMAQVPRPGRELLIALAAGVLFAGDLTFWNTGILLSGATNPTLMGNTAPIWVGIGAFIFFHERLSFRFWLGLVLALAGAILILGLDALQGFSLGLGTFFGLLAGIFYGGYFLVLQRSRRQLNTVMSFTLVCVGGIVTLFLLTRIFNQPLTGYSLTAWLSFLGLGLIVHGFGQFSFSFALGYLPASRVAPIGLMQPVVTAMLAVPLLGETISPGQVIGGITVLTGVFIVQMSRR